MLSLNPLIIPLSSGETPIEDHNRTILLDESAIKGKQLGKEGNLSLKKKRADLPALSTALRWEGNDIIALDIPKEILDQLTQPDLSYVLGQNSVSEEID